MKKLALILLLSVLSVGIYSQRFNTASALKKRVISVGINPLLWNQELGFFAHGGYGLTSGIDVSVKYGVLKGSDYFGADIEYQLLSGMPNVSVIGGAHVMGDVGVDVGGAVSIPLGQTAELYSGMELDINLGDDTQLLGWIPIGVEIYLQRKLSFLLEADVPFTEDAVNIFGGGVMFYFR